VGGGSGGVVLSVGGGGGGGGFQGKRQCFSIFYDVNIAKLTMNFLTFPSVKFHKFDRLVTDTLLKLVGALFFLTGKSI